ncbi:MAG: response regulator [Lachnospiraceae bacterium]|nr:response regulator [Lachnospiraceae bacterium]MBP5184732.1 response regulator [Lachnospiraceae bacterium]
MADKYNVLITGKHSVTIDAFFMQLSNDFDLMTTSLRPVDLERHIKICMPDMLVVCLSGDSQEEMLRFRDYKGMLNEIRTKVCVIGDPDEVNAFQNATHDLAYLELRRPSTMTSMREAMIEALERTKIERDTVRAELGLTAPTTSKPAPAPAAAPETRETPEVGRASLKPILTKEDEYNRRKHILVVDDDPVMLKVIKETLKEDFDVATAVNGKVALSFLKAKKTDIIILDYEMPEMSGPEVLMALRKEPATAQIPVLFLTGVTDQEKMKNALTYKPQGYIVKPVSGKKLHETIDMVINKMIEAKFRNKPDNEE